MAEKQYIRLVHEGEKWNGMVAEFIEEWRPGYSTEQMIVFYSDGARRWYIEVHKVEFITKKEYFTAKLEGKMFV